MKTTLLCLLATLPIFAQDSIPDPDWHYTTDKPAEGWNTGTFDDSGWHKGPGGFGTPDTPGSRVGTMWSTSDIWMRRTISLAEVPANPALYVNFDNDAEVYVNGKLVAEFKGWNTEYQVHPLEGDAAAALQQGDNLVAVHCHQDEGGQAIDVHLIDADKVPTLPDRVRPRAKARLRTTWGENATADNAWREYPRPQLQRENWTCLNGMWNYAISSSGESAPENWDGEILVPFCVESALSGVEKVVTPEDFIWYRRDIEVSPGEGNKVMLNFEAVDYQSTVWVNDTEVGSHTGGNLPFSFDITGALKPGKNTLTLRVTDATDTAYQLHGKQVSNPGGIWYTPVSGIWQTVWLEEVPAAHLKSIKMTPKVSGVVDIVAEVEGAGELTVEASLDGQVVATAKTNDPATPFQLEIPDPKLWSPDSPTLYDLKVTFGTDSATSYLGLRETTMEKDSDGHLRFLLNGKPIFHWGTLDQGWWPDGLLTSPSDEGMVSDIQFLKDAGFNLIRKHIKVEPRRYYYACDKIGMMMWQDQVSSGTGKGRGEKESSPDWTRLAPNPTDAEWPDEAHQQYMAELKGMMDQLHNHPCIVQWVPFNEAWGQHRTVEVGKWTVDYDPSRQVNIASGGNWWPAGHIVDAHAYPHPNFPFNRDRGRFDGYVKVMGEFGGHGFPVEGHLWNPDANNWGYGGLPKDKDEWLERYRISIDRLAELKKRGIAAGIYTQTTDVEGEINGLITYDRKVQKLEPAVLKEIHEKAGLLAD